MLQFTGPGTDFSGALHGSYDVATVALSCLLAGLAAYAALLMCEHIQAAKSARARFGWFLAGSITLGNGVWAMHFLGMLAFRLPLPVSYDAGITLLSGLPAVVAAAIALYVMGGNRYGRLRYVLAGCCVGAGIGLMHYTGMAAMRLSADMRYDPQLFALSIVVAVALGIAALYAYDLGRAWPGMGGGNRLRPISAALMGLAISGMHYTAMAAVSYFPGEGHGHSRVALDPFWLGAIVAGVTLVIVGAAIVAAMVQARLARAERHARLDRERIQDAIEAISDGFILFDGRDRLLFSNRVLGQMYPGLADMLRPGVSLESVLHAWAGGRKNLPGGMDRETFVAACVEQLRATPAAAKLADEEELPDGRWVYLHVNAVSSGGTVAVVTDVTPLKKLQSFYEERANHDGLTGLPNRHLFQDRLSQAASRVRRGGGKLAVLYIDLDGFKPINDTLGHAAGDAVLQEVARRLRDAVRESDTVARLGGDEFAVLLEIDGDVERAESVAARILRNMIAPVTVSEQTCKVGASIGIAASLAAGKRIEAIMQRADAAMYEAKQRGGGVFCWGTV